MVNDNARPLFLTLILALSLLIACGSRTAQAAQTYGTLLSYDFDTTAWPGAFTENVGTIDAIGTSTASLGVRSAGMISSGPLPINITETNLGKLTLAFSLSASDAKPVTVRVESYDVNKNRTGGLIALIYPAAPNFYQRYALDLSTFRPTGAGTFVPNAPYVSFSFSAEGAPWQTVSSPEIRVDNVNYALPAYYVGGTGSSDFNDGRSETTPFATVQKGINSAQAGDIVVVRSGTYNGTGISSSAQGGTGSVAAFGRPGTPANWIVLKNYPGESPLLWSNAWNIISITEGSKTTLSSIILAYLEVRGIHIRGQGDLIYNNGNAGGLYPGTIGQAVSQSNSNGISIDGRYMTTLPHHIRFANNFVEYCPGGGISSIEGDWVTVENNISSNNCWTMIYAGSGISILGDVNYDTVDNVYKKLVRNNVCYGNQCFEKWASLNPPAYSDGNGIILDTNQKTSTFPNGSYIGRTLVQSNLSFNNGGGGVHAFEANRVDIINNTAYLNSASPYLQYAEIDGSYLNDCRITNNILVAPTGGGEPVNSNNKSTNVVFSHNIYYGGNIAPVMGSGDVIADPQFVNPSIDPAAANFHEQTTSPARATGLAQSWSPFLDLDGNPRAATPDKGVYQLTPTTTTLFPSSNPALAQATLTLTASVTTSPASITGSTPTGTITFSDGSTTLAIVTITGGVATYTTSTLTVGNHTIKAVYSGDNSNIPSTSATLTEVVNAVVITGNVTLPNWVGTPQPLVFTLTPTGTTTGSVLTQTITPAANGAFTLSNVVPGTYTLGIKGNQWLQKDLSVSTVMGSALGLSATLLAGDLNGDNQVAGTDIAILRAAYGSFPGVANWNPLADMNGDGTVSATDLAMMRANYGRLGDP